MASSHSSSQPTGGVAAAAPAAAAAASLSFSPADTLAQAMRTMQAARDTMARFAIPQQTTAVKSEPMAMAVARPAASGGESLTAVEAPPAAESRKRKAAALDQTATAPSPAPATTAKVETEAEAAMHSDEDMDTGDNPALTAARDASTPAPSAPIAEEEAPPPPPPPCLHYVSRGPAFAASATPGEESLPSFASLAASGSLARVYPFELDDFQQRSVEVLENHQHLFVAAHTSAGKTVVAEYAISMVMRENERARQQHQLQAAGSRAAQQASTLPPTQKRVIYTSPIKALSNQKYREFKEIYTGQCEDVGLMTGDVMLNPNAPCLIMTTEILRAMLYNGSEVISDCSAVIFDEIHYMRDIERGIIWEESILMLPAHVQCIFLSATLSNTEEFAEWIHDIKAAQIREAGRHHHADHTADATHAEPASSSTQLTTTATASSSPSSSSIYSSAVCHVVYTNKRPIPLVHYAFLKGGAGLYQLKSERSGVMNVANFRKIQQEIASQETTKRATKSAFGDLIARQHAGAQAKANGDLARHIQEQLSVARATKRAEVPDLVRLITLAVEQDWLPLIVFSFSRRECEHLSLTAGDPRWKLDLTSREEKEMIKLVWDRAMEGLQACDRELPQLSYLLPLVLRGFAVHHSGLLPILKEVIEILFQEHLVKCLFATETFAMGLNMPARSVVFTSLEKFDGRATRYLQPAEYTQMAGRAGRRGVDTKGIVIVMLGPKDIEASAAALVSSGITPQPGEEVGGMLRQLLTGSTDPLQSKFRLTYNMILNLIRCSSTFDPAYILGKSFLHFQEKHPFTYRRAITATRNNSTRTQTLTNVSGKRARMGEGGISSLAAGGSELVAQQSLMRSSVADLQQSMAEIDEQLTELGLSPQQREQILAFQTEYARLQQLQQQQYEYGMRHPMHAVLPFLQSGRLVYVRQPAVAATNTTSTQAGKDGTPAVDWGWGIVIHWRKRHAAVRTEADQTAAAEYVVDVLLPVGLSSAGNDGVLTESVKRWGEVTVPLPSKQLDGPQGWENGQWDLQRADTQEDSKRSDSPAPSAPAPLYHVINCSLSMVHSISAVRLYLPPSLLLAPGPQNPSPQATRHALFAVCAQTMRNFPHLALPKIRPEDSDDGDAMRLLTEQLEVSELALRTSPVLTVPLATVQSFLRLHAERTSILAQVASFTSTLSSTHLTSYRIELKTRLRILRRFKLLSADGLITNKGRIAAEIESTDELLVTEFIYEGHWTSLTTAELVAVLTALLDVERSNADKLTIPTKPLQEAFGHLQGLARTIATTANECGLVLDSHAYVGSFKHDLIPIAHAWLTDPQCTFAQLLTMSNLFEGSLIRIFRRLDELLNQLMKAARNIGEMTLFGRLEEGQRLMKKGIMFAGSLYI